MNLRLLAGLTAAAILASVASYQWGYHKAWDAGRQNLVAEQQKLTSDRLARQTARQLKDDVRAAAADAKGKEEAQVIVRDVVRYVKDPSRARCTFDANRVDIKRRAAENANRIPGYDDE